MIDFRLFYPKISLEDQARQRRPLAGHENRRVYQLPADPRIARNLERR